MNGDIIFYLSGGLLLVACLLKLPALIRSRGQDRLLAAICALLLVGGGVIVAMAQSSIIFLRRTSGVENMALPVIYVLLMACSGASVVLIVQWRGGDAAQVRQLSRITIATYAIVCVLIAVLFALGSTPVERRSDFDLYYARTPYIREMIVLYLVAHFAASTTAGRLCWRWSQEVHGSLRFGLRVLAAAHLLNYGVFDPATGLAVAGRWFGYNLHFLITIARLMIVPSAVLMAVGFIVPLLGQRCDDTICYWQLSALEKLVEPVTGAMSPVTLRLPWWRPAARLRLTQRQTVIVERLLICKDHFDVSVMEHARLEAAEATKSFRIPGSCAEAIGDAAMIAVAVERHRVAPAARVGEAVDPELNYTTDLVSISQALRCRIVRNAKRRALHPAVTS